jgi:hypothetical protein
MMNCNWKTTIMWRVSVARQKICMCSWPVKTPSKAEKMGL